MESLDEIYIQAQIEVNDLLRKEFNKDEILKSVFSNYRRSVYYERKLELLKQYCLENEIIGREQDLELYNSSSASFQFNDVDLEKQLEEAKTKVKDLTTALKSSSNTNKINKKIICLGKSKEVRNNIRKVN